MELSKTKLSLYSTLQSAKMRNRHGLFIAEGEKLVGDTCGAFVAEALVATPQWLDSHPDALGFDPAVVREADSRAIAKISAMMTPPPVVAVYRMPQGCGGEGVRLREGELALMLDGIQDPGNLGTIVRTADWFGVHTVVASEDTADIFNPKAVQATMGAISRVRVVYADLAEVVAANPGAKVYGTLLEGHDMYEMPLTEGGFVIMGNEGKGISPAVRGMITDGLLIPPYGDAGHGESLNVAAATAIILAEFRRRL